MKFIKIYKTTCQGCHRMLKSNYKYCAKCGTFNQVDLKETIIFNLTIVLYPVIVVGLIVLLSDLFNI